MRVLVTGSAGFIGFHTARMLLEQGATVLGVDNFTPYYDPALKERRNAIDRVLKHRALPDQLERLFGSMLAAERPEPRAAASGHDDGVVHIAPSA